MSSHVARDGTPYEVRIAQPSDEPALVRMLESLHPDEVSLRFFVPLRCFSRVAHQMLEDDERLHFAFVASPAGAPGEVVATAMLAVLPGLDRGEFALVVHHAHARRGLGLHLLQRVLAAAREHGVREVFGLVLKDNHPMLGLARRAGFTLEPDVECPEAMRVVQRVGARLEAA